MTDKTNRIELDDERVPTLEEACVGLLEEVIDSDTANKKLIKISTTLVLAARAKLKETRLQTIVATKRLQEMSFKTGIHNKR